MDKRIIIIHPFEVIRKGLWAILRETFHYEFILLPTVDSLKDYSGLQNMQLLLIIDEHMHTNENHVIIEQRLGQENNIKWLSLGVESVDGKKDTIAFNQPAEKITEQVKLRIERPQSGSVSLQELTEREKDVLSLVALGHINKEIADKLFISVHTVISHRKNITEKLGIKSISGLTVYAILNKLIDTENIDPSSLI